MRLQQRLSRQVLRSGVVFGGIALILSLLFFQYTVSVHALIDQTGPAVDAMEDLLLGVYRDDILLVDYLAKEDVENTVGILDQLEQSNAQSRIVIAEVDSLIERGVIADALLIEAFARAKTLSDQVEQTRTNLIQLHLQDLQTAADLSFDKAALLAVHRKTLTSATGELSGRIAQITGRSELLQQQLLARSRWYLAAMLLSFIGFIAHVSWHIRKASALVVEPVDEAIGAMERFRKGEYTLQLRPSLEVEELGSLQEGINKVFSLIADQARIPAMKSRIEKELLAGELADILDFLKAQKERGRKVSISDLKKHQGVTHPTILGRIRELEATGLIRLERSGRAKYLQVRS